MADHTESEITVADHTIRVLRGGTGPTMLYLHGAGGLAGWAPFMEGLAKSFDLIVPEHPGFGTGEDPPWLDNIHDEAYFYLSFMEALDLTDVHLVGMSIGGWLAAEIAVRLGEPHPLRRGGHPCERCQEGRFLPVEARGAGAQQLPRPDGGRPDPRPAVDGGAAGRPFAQHPNDGAARLEPPALRSPFI